MTAPHGKTSPRVRRLGLGLAALGRPGYITLGHSADLGVRATSYGITAARGRNEVRVKRWENPS